MRAIISEASSLYNLCKIIKKGGINVKGIYYLAIGNRYYIGRDSEIHRFKRVKEHLNKLKKGSHYNSQLQKEYSKNRHEVRYGILWSCINAKSEELDERERDFIQAMRTFDEGRGFNLTLGGYGMLGYTRSEEANKIVLEKISGGNNGSSKISNKQFFEIVDLIKKGKTNQEVASVYGLHPRYVSLIRHKKRFTRLWSDVKEYIPIKSNGRKRKLTYNDFLHIMELLPYRTNRYITDSFGLAEGAVSRIRHQRIYKDYWRRYKEEVCSTTIETTPKGGRE